MTGPEHYREAEMLLASVGADAAEESTTVNFDDRSAQIIAAAQVHATLALVAAAAVPSDTATEDAAWRAVAGQPGPA